MEYLWWTLTIALMLLGLVGAVFPVWPDSLLILAGAFLHHFTMPAGRTVGWWTLGALTLLCILAHVIDFTAGALGAKKFGGTRWGALGGIIGGIVGTIFFFPFGIFLGPVVGVLCAEVVLSQRTLGPAVKSSWGSFLGTTAGLIGKAMVDVVMIALFFAVIFFNHSEDAPVAALIRPKPALTQPTPVPAQPSPAPLRPAGTPTGVAPAHP